MGLHTEAEKIMEKELIEVISIWDSNAEKIAYDILKEKINTTNYHISKHVALKEIFKGKQEVPWMNCHVDFLIEDSKGFPVMGIEINGIKHWNKPERKGSDKNKRIIFAEAGVPLIFIPLPEIPSFTKEEYKTEYPKALRELINNYLIPAYHRTFYPVYCRKCGKQMAYRIKNNYTGTFYCCLNSKCDFKSISSDKVPPIFQ